MDHYANHFKIFLINRLGIEDLEFHSIGDHVAIMLEIPFFYRGGETRGMGLGYFQKYKT